MQGIQRIMLCWSNLRCWAGVAALVTILAILAGCAPQSNIKPAPDVPPPPPAPVISGPSVSRLQDGREGFIITEVPQMDNASSRDFDSAVAMLNEGDYDKAIELLEKVIEKSPAVTAPYINLGMAYQHAGKLEEAEAQFKTALQMIPGHPVACNQYGLLLRKTGRFDEARKIYEEALSRFPDYYPVHRNLGILCDLYLDDLESALVHYETYSKGVPEDTQVKLWIADLHARTQNK